jgi:predicted dehydrogenase
MSAPCNWAIVGTGTIARKLAAALAHVPGARLGGVVSRDFARAQAFAAACGALSNSKPVRATTQLEEVLADPDIRIIYIAAPNHLHASLAITCLSAGKAVMCEKPLALNAAEAREIAAAAEASGQFCMEAMWTLCLPALDRLRALVSAGAIGEIVDVSGNLSYPHAYDPTDRFFNPLMGGGALLDLGVYPLALTLALLGAPREVRGLVRRAPNGIDMQAHVLLGFDTAQASLGCGFAAMGENSMVITGTRGVIRLQAPLNAPALISLTPTKAAQPYGGTELGPLRLPDIGNAKTDAIRQMLRPLKPGRTKLIPVPFRGNGLVHQIEEAMACMADGRLQSGKMPLALSIDVLEVIDQVRALNPVTGT